MAITALIALVLPLQSGPAVEQWGSLDALLTARYDGKVPIRDLMRPASLGMGTFNGLNGEMVVLDGKVYQIDGFGDVHQPDPSTRTPFAFVTSPFRPTDTFTVKGPISVKALGALIDRKVGRFDGILAIRVDSALTEVHGRSFAAQLKPYRPFGEIGDRQTIFNHASLSATLVGYRMPESVKQGNLNVPGYHFHFLSQDRTTGGHLLDALVQGGTVRVMRVAGIQQSVYVEGVVTGSGPASLRKRRSE